MRDEGSTGRKHEPGDAGPTGAEHEPDAGPAGAAHEPADAGPSKDAPPHAAPPAAANLALIGFMAAGKTTVGRLLAAGIGWRFLDLDDEIVRETGLPIAEIFLRHGEAAFRELESRLTARLSSVHHAVIAPGGGWVLDPTNARRLPPATHTVWLRVSAEEAVRRVLAAGPERPILSGVDDPVAVARALLERREPLYRSAHSIVDVDGRSPAQIVGDIRSRIRFEG